MKRAKTNGLMLLTIIIVSIVLAHGCGKGNCYTCRAYENQVKVGERKVCNDVEKVIFEGEFYNADDIDCGD